MSAVKAHPVGAGSICCAYRTWHAMQSARQIREGIRAPEGHEDDQEVEGHFAAAGKVSRPAFVIAN